MERTARYADWQVKVVGLLTALAAACATVQQPPGGPFDASPPVLLGIVPDSGAVVPGFDDDVEFQFDEVINERSGGDLENLIHVSPRHEEVRVSWRRNRVTVKPRGGWMPGETYTVSIERGIADLRQNINDSSKTIVFSTGTSIPATAINGNVVDWEAGRIATTALIELIRDVDSVSYVGSTDSSGVFVMTGVPPGPYRLIATIDANNNDRREGREAFDSVLVTVGAEGSYNLWTFVHDSTGPTMRTAEIVDSLAIATEFTQMLAQDLENSHTARVFEMPDSLPVGVAFLLWRPDFDSLRTAQRDSITAMLDSIAAAEQDSIAAALRDSLGTDSLAIDSVFVDTLVADTATVDSLLVEEIVAEPDSTPPDEAAEADRREALLSQRPPIYNTFIIVLNTELLPGVDYVIETRVANLLGHAETSTRTLTVPVPADSTTPPDST